MKMLRIDTRCKGLAQKQLDAAAHQLGNTSSRTITEVKQC